MKTHSELDRDGNPKARFDRLVTGVTAVYSDPITINGDPGAATEIAWGRPLYDDGLNLTVDTDAISFLASTVTTPHVTVRLATAAALPAYTYLADVITANANGALTVDGAAVAAADLVVVKNGAAATDNGIYTVTATGSAGAPFVLTRVAAYATTIRAGLIVAVTAGTANAGLKFSVAGPLLQASFDIELAVSQDKWVKVLDVTAVANADEDFTVVNQVNIYSRKARVKIIPTAGAGHVTVRQHSKAA